MNSRVICYIDGSYSSNTQYRVGFAGIIMRYHTHFYFVDYFCSKKKLTSIVAELMACITLLYYIRNYFDHTHVILVFIDSEYIVKIINGIYGNINVHHDIWNTILFMKRGLNIQFRWIKAHNGNIYNEFCDKMSRIAREWHIRHAGIFKTL